MNKEISLNGQRMELTKEMLFSLRGMNLVEFFLRMGEDPARLLEIDPEAGQLISELKESREIKGYYDKEIWGKVFQTVCSGVGDDILGEWLDGLKKISDLGVHAWCRNFAGREGLLMRDQTSRYNFYTEIQGHMCGVIEGIADERDRRLARQGI